MDKMVLRGADFDMLDCVGRGEYGRVYRVKRKADGKVMCWKEMRFSSGTDRRIKYAEQEVKLMMELRGHPNVVKMVGSFQQKNPSSGGARGVLSSRGQRQHQWSHKTVMILEFCESGDLRKWVDHHQARNTYVDERKIWKVAAHMAAALYTMHSRPEGAALHSDIKPENIFVCADGTCKLGDFGLSTTLSQDAPYAKGAAGTPYYMAPEKMNNLPFNESSDIWSLGCTLMPYDGRNFSDLARNVRKGAFRPVSKHYSQELADLIHKMMSQESCNRPTSAELCQHPRLVSYLKDVETALLVQSVLKRNRRISNNLLTIPASLRGGSHGSSSSSTTTTTSSGDSSRSHHTAEGASYSTESDELQLLQACYSGGSTSSFSGANSQLQHSPPSVCAKAQQHPSPPSAKTLMAAARQLLQKGDEEIAPRPVTSASACAAQEHSEPASYGNKRPSTGGADNSSTHHKKEEGEGALVEVSGGVRLPRLNLPVPQTAQAEQLRQQYSQGRSKKGEQQERPIRSILTERAHHHHQQHHHHHHQHHHPSSSSNGSKNETSLFHNPLHERNHQLLQRQQERVSLASAGLGTRPQGTSVQTGAPTERQISRLFLLRERYRHLLDTGRTAAPRDGSQTDRTHNREARMPCSPVLSPRETPRVHASRLGCNAELRSHLPLDAMYRDRYLQGNAVH